MKKLLLLSLICINKNFDVVASMQTSAAHHLLNGVSCYASYRLASEYAYKLSQGKQTVQAAALCLLFGISSLRELYREFEKISQQPAGVNNHPWDYKFYVREVGFNLMSVLSSLYMIYELYKKPFLSSNMVKNFLTVILVGNVIRQILFVQDNGKEGFNSWYKSHLK